MAAEALTSAAALAAATPSGGMPPAAAAIEPTQALSESDALHAWLVDEAGLSQRVAGKVGKVLEAEDVETVDNLVWFTGLQRFNSCGISALAADMICAAITGRSGPAVVAGAGSFTTPTSTRMPGKDRGARASRLSSPPVRALFQSPEAGSSHYDGGPMAGEPARPQSAARASLGAAAAQTAGTGAIEVLPTSGLVELKAAAAVTLQGAARRRRARSRHGSAAVAAVRVQRAARRLLALRQLQTALRAVVKLQAAARRLRWAGRRDDLRAAVAAVVRVQAAARGWVARWDCADQRWGARRIQRQWRCTLRERANEGRLRQARHEREVQLAAYTIQEAFFQWRNHRFQRRGGSTPPVLAHFGRWIPPGVHRYGDWGHQVCGGPDVWTSRRSEGIINTFLANALVPIAHIPRTPAWETAPRATVAWAAGALQEAWRLRCRRQEGWRLRCWRRSLVCYEVPEDFWDVERAVERAKERQVADAQSMAGCALPRAAESVSQTDGQSTTTTATGLAALPLSQPPCTASAPRGAAETAAARAASIGRQPFVLRAGRPPDAHVPFEFRHGRRMYETLELYDRWLRETQLEVDEWDELHLDDGEAQGEAGRVTHLLWYFLTDRLDEPRLDASRPAAAQQAEFARLGWDLSPPTAGQLMRLMVQSAESSYHAERRCCPYGPLHAQTMRDYFNTNDSRSWLKGVRESDEEADVDRNATELDAYASHASEWACY